MSQIFDYFVCSPEMADRWANALAEQDDDLQATLERAMPRFVTLKNIGQDEINILAACISGQADTVKAVGEVDLIKAISGDEGPWLMAFRVLTVAAIASAEIAPELLERWSEAVSQHHGTDIGRNRVLLSADAARQMQELCTCAIRDGLRLFICFYG